MRFYETIFIVKPDVSDEVLAERQQWAKDILTTNGAQIVHTEQWGKKRLAYQVKKQRYGHFILMQYEGELQVVPELERNFKLSEDVLKYITIRLEGKQIEKARAAAVKAAEEAARREQARIDKEAEAEVEAKAEVEAEAEPTQEAEPQEDSETPSEDSEAEAAEPVEED